MDAITFLLGQLKLDSNRLKLLDELKSALSVVDIETLPKDLPLTSLFNGLFSSNVEEVELCCYVLNKLLLVINAEVVLAQYSLDFIRALACPNSTVKEFSIKQIGRCFKEIGQKTNVISEDIILAICDAIDDESIGVASRSRELLECLAKSSDSTRLFSSAIMQRLADLASKSDVVRFRVYELVVNISKKSETHCQQFINSGLLSHLVEDMNSNDILVQLNCLELLSELAMAIHGFVYLENSGVVAKVERMMIDVDNIPMSSLLLPGLMKFFGCLGHQYPKEICGNYRGFVEKVLDTLSGDNLVLKGIAIDTIAILGSSAEGKLALEKLGNRMTQCLVYLAQAMASSAVDTRVAVLNCIVSLLTLDTCEQTCELTTLTKTWFHQIFKARPLDCIQGLCRQPFLEMRYAALQVLTVLAKQEWGQVLFKEQPGFLEYILDMSTESDKLAKEAKFEVVKVLAESPSSDAIFGSIAVQKFIERVNEGPFYVKTDTQVATDDAQ